MTQPATSGSDSQRRISRGDGFNLESHGASPTELAEVRELRQRIVALVTPGLLNVTIADLILDGNSDDAIRSFLKAAIRAIPTIREQVQRNYQMIVREKRYSKKDD